MSLLDIDERLVAVAGSIDIVYSPIVDTRVYPEAVDVCLVEGAVSTQEDVEKLHTIRENTRLGHLLWRLRRHRQCSRHAQPVQASGCALPGLP